MAIKISGTTIIDDTRLVNDARFQAYKEKIVTVGSVAVNTNLDLTQGNLFDVTLGANNLVFTFTNPPASGFSQPATIILRQDATGGRKATFTGALYTDGLLPQLSTGAADIDVFTFFTINAGTNWFGTFAMANVS
jgi:hypothetical protein